MSDVYIETVEGGETTTPTTHKIELSDGTNSTYITWSNVKAALKTYFDSLYAAITHTHAASDITSGTMATARLGSGTANSSKRLAGDSTWVDGREVLTAARTYYVRTDGSDSNTGLANTAGGAFLTIQKAIDIVATLDISTYDVTIKLADGTYTITTPILTKSPLGSGKVIIEGNTTTPANAVITSSTSSCNLIQHDNQTTVYQIKGVKFTHTGAGYSICLYAIRAKLEFTTVDFGAVSAGEHIRPSVYGLITAIGNYTISGGAARHILVVTARIEYLTTHTVTLTGTPAFTQFIYVSAGSGFVANGTTTFSGAATGQRYYVDYNGVLATNGGGANFFPGDSAGATATGGQYA